MGRFRRYFSLALLYILVLGVLLSAGFFGDRAVTAMNTNNNSVDRTCIIVDAGHGGVDGGTTSCTGVTESHLNLEISLRMNDLLNLLGLKTRMIRTTDCSVYTSGETIAAKKVSDLKKRVEIVNSTENGVLLSIHQNYFSQSKYFGAQVFYGKDEASKHLAKNMQEMLVHNLNPTSNRAAKKTSGVYLFEKISKPGVLLECGFLSNPQEEALLRDAAYQKKLCVVVCTAIADFVANEQLLT